MRERETRARWPRYCYSPLRPAAWPPLLHARVQGPWRHGGWPPSCVHTQRAKTRAPPPAALQVSMEHVQGVLPTINDEGAELEPQLL